MRILGVGTDVVDIPTFAEQLSLPGSQLRDVFTARERRRAEQRAAEYSGDGETGNENRHLAANWALKEAFIKAWSGALAGSEPPLVQDEVVWSEIEVKHDRWGRPQIMLSGSIRKWVSHTLDTDLSGTDFSVHASASHDGAVACALVVLERA